MALGLRVVSDDGGPERFRQALFRALSGFVEIWMFAGGPAVICSMLSARGKRIGDVFAGTMVISERAPKLPAPVPMPPALAWWASSLQLSALRPEQAELARQFLSRASQLEPQLRDQMAYRICAEVVAQISPPPPAGAPPPLVLAAVLAERHRRELAPAPRPVAATATRASPRVGAVGTDLTGLTGLTGRFHPAQLVGHHCLTVGHPCYIRRHECPVDGRGWPTLENAQGDSRCRHGRARGQPRRLAR